MITGRALKQWRKEALKESETFNTEMYNGTAPGLAAAYQKSLKRILRMTQELLDLHLTRK